MNTYFRPALVVLLLLSALTGLAYPFAITSLGQLLFPAAANGSLLRKDGAVIGSTLIGQNFTSDRYFHTRPSATSTPDPVDAAKTVDAPYNAASSSASNLAPSSSALKEAIAERAKAYGESAMPADLVTASASGLDPHISPAAALVQVPRIAKARGITEDVLRIVVQHFIEARDFGVLGQPRVNVLALNLALDKLKP